MKTKTADVARWPTTTQLALDIGRDVSDGVEVLRQHLLVEDRDLELGLEEADDLEHAGRVDDPAVEQRFVVAQVARHEEVLQHETADAELAVHAVSTCLPASHDHSRYSVDVEARLRPLPDPGSPEQ